MDFIFHSLGMSSTGIKILGDLVQIGTDFTVLPDQLPKYFDVCDNFIMRIGLFRNNLRRYSEREIPTELAA